MNKKKVIIALTIVCAIGFCMYGCINKENGQESTEKSTNIESKNTEKTNSKEVKKDKTLKKQTNKNNNDVSDTSESTEIKEESNVIHTNLYSDAPSSVLPLSVIAEMSSWPENIQKTVLNISQNGNIYMIQKNHNKLLIITDNTENIRHGIEFNEINIQNGHQVKTTLGYNDKIKDSQNDIWEYSSETNQPTRHTKYNSDGDMEFVEVWNYDDQNPIKYEMKDSDGKVISMRKETLKDGTELRVEHLLYDKDGKTRINVSASFDGEDIKRFTYYNADKQNESCSIFGEYSDGQKTKETVYTSDLKVKNTYTSDYKDGNREDIIKWDNQNKEVKKYLPAENL